MDRTIVDPTEVAVHEGRLRLLLDRVRLDVEQGPLPSAQIAVARHGRLVAYETFGDATPATRYVTQSAGRPILAIAMWKLLSDGLLDLDEPVAEVIPEFRSNGKDAVTFRHVLTHTGGFPMAPLGFPKMLDRQQRLEAFARWRLTYDPGTQLEFHLTSAAWVLTELCERRTGLTYREYLRREIAEPLGLTIDVGVPEGEQGDIAPLEAIGLPPGEEPPIDPWGPFYLRDPAVLAAGEASHSTVATAADQALLMQAVYHSGRWTEEAVAEATRVQVDMDVTGDYGSGRMKVGLFVIIGGPPTMSGRAFGHTGAPSSLAWCDPETGLSVCFLTNGYPATGYDVGRSGRNRSLVIGSLAGDVLAD